MKLKKALELALSTLQSFQDTSLWDDYSAAEDGDGFTVEEWDAMMEKLRSLASMGESVLDRARTQIRDGVLYSYPKGDLCEAPEATIEAISGLIGDSYDIETSEVSETA